MCNYLINNKTKQKQQNNNKRFTSKPREERPINNKNKVIAYLNPRALTLPPALGRSYLWVLGIYLLRGWQLE